jgi:cytochrome c
MKTNKIFASILVAIIIAMLCSFISGIIYKTDNNLERGFIVSVSEDQGQNRQEDIQKEKIDIASLMQNANESLGAKIIKKCISCHTLDKGGSNKIGPNLWNIHESTKATKNYNYSKAMASKEGTWSDENLFNFLRNPKEYIPGTKMMFAGLKKPEEAAAVIAFLKTLKSPR